MGIGLDVDAQIRQWLAEDLGAGDVTTDATVSRALVGRGLVKAKSDLVLSGMSLVPRVFDAVEPGRVTVLAKHHDGERVAAGTVVAEVSGPFSVLLKGERLALNLLMRLSGVASFTALAVATLGDPHTKLIDTRKTTPGLRVLEKQAVVHGGGRNHRHGLADGVLIKDNHIAAAGGAVQAITRARASVHHLLKIECEIHRLDQIEGAIAAGADALLLDNMDDASLREAVAMVGKRVLTEASGNMSLDRLPRLRGMGLDFISMGALTHSAVAADLSMKIELV